MAEKLQAVKGMNDVLPPVGAKWRAIERRAQATFEAFGYREVRTPLLEYTPLFVRTIGEVTDIVEKEMYTFEDRDGRSLTLRPEGTASAVRALVEASALGQDPVVRWYYGGPMFRHEKAQRGRYRQFYQMGCEVFGVAEPSLDAEMMAMVQALFTGLGVDGLSLRVNSVGGAEDRPRYRAALVEYFSAHRAELCADCQRRLEQNPLRILDCKNEPCLALAQAAPSILEHLGEPARAHFDEVLRCLGLLGVTATVDARMVRGLDYYTGTVFEVRGTTGELGAQNTLCGGGRYDTLVEELGGPKGTPAVGFAFGLERLALAMPGAPEEYEPRMEVFVMAQPPGRDFALALAHRLRLAGRRVELSHRAASFKSQIKRADKLRARVTVIVGAEELAQGAVKLRDMDSGEETLLPQGELPARLDALLGPPKSL
jgi:histidyl-tRNA synthetase